LIQPGASREDRFMATPQEALTNAVDSWNAGNLDGYLELYREDITLHGYSPEPMGKQEVRGFYEATFAAFDKPQLHFHEVLWDGAKCSIRFTLSGRHAGAWLGVPATGTDVAVPGITILHFDGEQVAERWSQADLLGFLVQVGAVPAPA
jgi:predicted ester cyclase